MTDHRLATAGTRVFPTNRGVHSMPAELQIVLNRTNSEQDIVAAIPVVGDTLSKNNYLEKLDILLHMEEYRSIISEKYLVASQVTFFSTETSGKLAFRRSGRDLRLHDYMLVVRRGEPYRAAYATILKETKTHTVVSLKTSREDGCAIDSLPEEKYDIYRMNSGHWLFRSMHDAVHEAFRKFRDRVLFPKIGKDELARFEFPQDIAGIQLFDTDLDDEQRQVVCDCIAGNAQLEKTFAYPRLITGGPGTGKTRVLVEVISQLYLRRTETRVLVCGYNDTSVSRIVQQFVENPHISGATGLPPFIFLTSSSRNLEEYMSHSVMPYVRSIGDASCTLDLQSRLIFTTCGTLGILRDRYTCVGHLFSHVIIDDCNMLTEPEALIPISLLHVSEEASVILAGDLCQLLPEVYCPVAAKNGLQSSLLFRLSDRLPYFHLETQYRTESFALKQPSRLIYDSSFLWKLNSGLSGKCQISGQTVNCSPRSADAYRTERCVSTKTEAVITYLRKLQVDGSKPANIGVICTERIKEELVVNCPKHLLPLCGGLGRFVGEERDIIILCLDYNLNWFVQDLLHLPGLQQLDILLFLVSRARRHLITVREVPSWEF